MPGTYRTYKLADGRYADVPEDQVGAFEQTMGSSGMGFEPSFDMTQGEPETIKSAPKLQPSMADRFLEANAPTVKDSMYGFMKGASAGLVGDELAGAIGGQDTGDYFRSQDLQAQERSPVAYGATQFLSSLPRNLAGGFLASLGQGALEGGMETEGGAMDRLGGAAKGAGTAALFHGMGEGAEAIGQKVGTPIRALGVATRRASATGASPENLGTIRQERGIDFMENGLDKRFEELGLAGSPLPQSAGGVYRKIGQEGDPDALLGQSGQRMGGAMDRAGEQGIRGDLTSVDQSMDNAMRKVSRAEVKNPESKGVLGATQAIRDELPIAPRSAYGRDPSEPPELPINANNIPMKKVGNPPSQKYADWLTAHEAETFPDDAPFPADVSERAVGYNPNLRTPRELHTQKREFDKGGYTNDLAPQSERVGAQAQRIGAGAYKAELDDAMQRSGPDNYADYEGGRQDFQDLELLGELSGKRVDQNASVAGIARNPFMYGGAGLGAAAGGAMGGLPGAALGAAVGGKFGQKYGQDIAGLGMMGVGKGIRGAGAAANAGLQGGISPAISNDLAGNMMGGTAQAQGPAEAYGGGTDHQQSLESGKGYQLTDVVLEVLQSEPDALQGYASVFGAAAASPEPSAVSSLITKLSRTDPNFRKNVLPGLRARTQGDY